MKININYFLFIVSFFIISSCEDVIDVELPIAEDVYVVDAWLTNRNESQEIILSQSQAYFDNGIPRPVSNAKVQLIRSNGDVIEFVHDGEGVYRWNQLLNDSLGTMNDRYTLQIDFGDQQLSASTTIHRVPKIDSLIVEFRDDEVFLDVGLYAQFYARDFIGQGDTYWIKTYRNDQFLNKAAEINLAYDAGFDSGTAIDGITFITPIRELINPVDEDGVSQPYAAGDVIRVEIHSLALDAFNFMSIVRDQITNGSNGIFSLPLANARTNIRSSNGGQVLGFFNVAAVEEFEIIAKE